MGRALPPSFGQIPKEEQLFSGPLPSDGFYNTGDTVCLSQDDTDQYICPTSTNLTCDSDRCPLQGPLIAPIKEAELTGVRKIIYTIFTVKVKFLPCFSQSYDYFGIIYTTAFCTRASNNRRLGWHGQPGICRSLPSPSLRRLLHPQPATV